MYSIGHLLVILCSCTWLLFGDRGVISSNEVSGDWGIRKEFTNVTIAQSGWLFSCNMIGVALAAPLAAQLASGSYQCNALRLVGIGVLLCSIGSAAAAFAPTFPTLLAARLLSGAGVGPMISLAPAIIDESSPANRRSSALAALFVCLPAGFASGYMWATLVARSFGWRSVFIVEAVAMAPFVFLLLLTNDPNDIHRASTNPASTSPRGVGFLKGVSILVRNPATMLSMLARALFLGALGGFSFFGSKAAKALFNLPPSVADLSFGACTIVTGSLGTISGGYILDLWGSGIRSALRLCIFTTLISSICLCTSYVFSENIVEFAPGFLLGEITMFATSAPATAAVMWSSPPELRPAALAFSEILNHALGDVPVPPLLGLLFHTLKNWRLTMAACMGVTLAASVSFTSAYYVFGWLQIEEVVLLDEIIGSAQEPLIGVEVDGGSDDDGDKDDGGGDS